MENPSKNQAQQQRTPADQEASSINQLIENPKEHPLYAASKETGNGTHYNEAKKIQQKNTKQVEPNNRKAENPDPGPIDEKDLPPFQAGKPTI